MAALLAAGLTPASAQTNITWASTSNTTFSNDANWSGGAAPPDDLTSNNAAFDGTGTANPVLTASRSVAGLAFSGGAYTLSSTGGAALTLGQGGILSTAGSQTISAPLVTGQTQIWRVSAGQLTVSGIVSGSGFAIDKTGSGTLVLSGANTYSGGTSILTGILDINNAQALGTGTLTINGSSAKLDNTSGSPITLSTNNAQSWGANFTFIGTNNLNLGSGAVTFGAARTITVSAGILTVGGVINTSASTVGLTKSGAGTLVLAGNSAYNATTTISAGTLQLGNGGATGAVTGAIVDNGSLVINRSGTLSNASVISGTGSVTLTGNGTVVLSGSNTYSGATTISAGTLALGSTGSIANSNTINLGTTASPGTLDVTAQSSFAFLSGQTVAGAGTINIGTGKTVTINGALAPGVSTGITAVTGNLALAGSAATTLAINGAVAGTGFDQVNVSGLTTYGGTLALNFGSAIASGTSLTLFGLSASGSSGRFLSVTATGDYTGSFTDIDGTWTLADGGQTLAFTEGTGTLEFSASAVPEPSDYALILGALALGAAVYRGRSIRGRVW